MADRSIRKRWLPLWAALAFFAGWCVLLMFMLASYVKRSGVDWDGLVGGLPLLWLLGYGVLCGLVNRSTLTVSKIGVEAALGPLPGGGRRKIPHNQIARCYFRRIVVPARFGTVQTYAAGVETKDSVRVDLLCDYELIEEAREVAHRIAGALGAPVEELTGAGRRDWVAMRRVILWGAALVAALIFAALKEF